MAGRLAPARREELAHECFQLSAQGHSLRAIARRLGISRPTASALVHEESQRLRRQNDDAFTKSLAAKWAVVQRLWEELNGSPFSHAAANLGHALRGLLSGIDRGKGRGTGR